MERNTRNGAGDIGVYAGTWDSGAFEGILLSEGGGFAGCLGYGTGWQRDEAVISGDRKALQNNASAGGVERAIRNAVEVSWERGNPEVFEDLFGFSRETGAPRPTNSEYIARIADKIRMDATTGEKIEK